MGKEDETSKELEAIADAIDKYIQKHKGNVCVHASFVAFKGKDCDTVDDRCFAYGVKDVLKIDIEEMLKETQKTKDDFVDWIYEEEKEPEKPVKGTTM